jgi:hypothetical protein
MLTVHKKREPAIPGDERGMGRILRLRLFSGPSGVVTAFYGDSHARVSRSPVTCPVFGHTQFVMGFPHKGLIVASVVRTPIPGFWRLAHHVVVFPLSFTFGAAMNVGRASHDNTSPAG